MIQGSDSGISLQSRDGSKSKHSFHSFDSPKLLGNKSDLSLFEEFGNLPFDMPKLRRKKMLMEQVRRHLNLNPLMKMKKFQFFVNRINVHRAALLPSTWVIYRSICQS